jgi:beta-lactamase superfamily II metal-dependent hydrolase
VLIAQFIDVGQGNMVLLQLGNVTTMLYDCNVTDENANRVLGYLGAVLPRRGIDFFANSHREADHIARGQARPR